MMQPLAMQQNSTRGPAGKQANSKYSFGGPKTPNSDALVLGSRCSGSIGLAGIHRQKSRTMSEEAVKAETPVGTRFIVGDTDHVVPLTRRASAQPVQRLRDEGARRARPFLFPMGVGSSRKSKGRGVLCTSRYAGPEITPRDSSEGRSLCQTRTVLAAKCSRRWFHA